MEYVIGWMTTKPGQRDEFLAQSKAFLTATRAEPGVLFFELLAGQEPDVAIAVEGYASADAHQAHVKTPHLAQFWTLFEHYVLEGRFENIAAESTRTDWVRPKEADA